MFDNLLKYINMITKKLIDNINMRIKTDINDDRYIRIKKSDHIDICLWCNSKNIIEYNDPCTPILKCINCGAEKMWNKWYEEG